MKADDLVEELREYAEFLGYLYDRWQDEREYEEFSDYKKVAKERCPNGYKFNNLIHKPYFQVTMYHPNGKGVFLKVTSTKYTVLLEV